jgi:16S rRNA (adenine1518-N6/adenine1519-N6)-dimethyltransferase
MSDDPGSLPTSVRKWRALIDSLGLTPSKGKGQNFLFERGVVDRIVRTAGVKPGDRVLEIGPGLGILTDALLDAGAEVTAVELDWRLWPHLHATFDQTCHFRLVEGDALAVPLDTTIPAAPYRLVANLPYSVGAAVVRRYLEADTPPATMTVMVQKEVAERMTADPPDLSILGIATRFFGDPRLAFTVPPGVFYPAPRVDSAVVHLVTREQPVPRDRRERFFRIVNAGFGQKRKNLGNSLAHGLGRDKPPTVAWLEAAGIDPMRRAETLSLAEWVRLAGLDPEPAE